MRHITSRPIRASTAVIILCSPKRIRNSWTTTTSFV